MNMRQINTPAGFRDFLPEQANLRSHVVEKLIEVFRSYGFEPLETPALEYASTLKGKYGEEEKLIYEFTTRGGDEVALRYDQTVPLARVIAQYPDLPKPFKRYQVQPVWRGESPQKGRYRELMHCDIDTIGSSSPLADAEIIACVLTTVKKLGLKDALMEINDRTIFGNLDNKYIVSIDKLKKIGAENVVKELIERGLPENKAQSLLDNLTNSTLPKNLQEIFNILEKSGFKEGVDFKFTPTLARGLDYYTGPIFELVSPSYGNNSLGGGGRYDELIGRYSGQDLPATGFAFGFDRIIEALNNLNLLPKISSSTKVLVTVFNSYLLDDSIEMSSRLRSNNINTEIWLGLDTKFDKQLKYADQKKIPYALILGPEEKEAGLVTLKNLNSKTQEKLSLDEVIQKLSS